MHAWAEVCHLLQSSEWGKWTSRKRRIHGNGNTERKEIALASYSTASRTSTVFYFVHSWLLHAGQRGDWILFLHCMGVGVRTALLVFTQLSSITEGFKLCWRTGQKLTFKPSSLGARSSQGHAVRSPIAIDLITKELHITVNDQRLISYLFLKVYTSYICFIIFH